MEKKKVTDPNISKELYNMENGIKILEYLDSDFRMELLIQLILNHELSLSKITQNVSKTKATVSKHLQELTNLGFLTIREKKVRGPIKKKFYSLNENVFKYLCANRILVRHLPEKHKATIYCKLIEHTNKEMDLIKQIIDLAKSYNKKLMKKVQEYEDLDEELTKQIYLKNRMGNFLFALDQKEIKIFYEEYRKFTDRIVDRFEEHRSRPDYNYQGKSNLVWVGYFPMAKIMKNEIRVNFEKEKLKKE